MEHKFEKHKVAEFEPEPELLEMTKQDWHNLNENHYNKIFKNSIVERIGFSGLKRNINFVRK